jgi:hypothetical protein
MGYVQAAQYGPKTQPLGKLLDATYLSWAIFSSSSEAADWLAVESGVDV